MAENVQVQPQDVLARADALRPRLGESFRDEIVKSLYREAETIAKRATATMI